MTCKVCGARSIGDLCFRHKKYPKKSPVARQSQKKEDSDKMFEFFLSIWDEREERTEGKQFINCYETGKYMNRGTFRGLTTCYHHVLEKSVYPSLKFCKENIVILHPDIHQQAHADIDKTPKIKALREELLKRYLNGELNETESI